MKLRNRVSNYGNLIMYEHQKIGREFLKVLLEKFFYMVNPKV